MRSLVTTRLGFPVVALLCTLALAGCGGGDDEQQAGQGASTPGSSAPATDSPSAADSTPAKPSKKPVVLPSCEKLWVEGKILPASYRGCEDEFGQVSKSLRGCFNRRLAQYGDQYYAIVGREVVKATPDREHNAAYMSLLESCSG